RFPCRLCFLPQSLKLPVDLVSFLGRSECRLELGDLRTELLTELRRDLVRVAFLRCVPPPGVRCDLGLYIGLDSLGGSLASELHLRLATLRQSRDGRGTSLGCRYFGPANVAAMVACVRRIGQGVLQVEHHHAARRDAEDDA